jgi:hypothetical protein
LRSVPQFGDIRTFDPELKALNTASELADAAVFDSNIALTPLKNDAYALVIAQTDDVADQVAFRAKGDELIRLAVGFDLK